MPKPTSVSFSSILLPKAAITQASRLGSVKFAFVVGRKGADRSAL